MKRAWLLLLATLLGAAVVLSACRTGGGNAGGDGPSPTASGSVSPGNQEKVKLTMTFWGGEKDKETYRQRLDLAQQKYPHIEVELIHVTGDYNQKLQTMIAGGTPPDIMEHAEGMQAYAVKGQLEPLDELAQEFGFNFTDHFDENLLNIFKYQGKVYAMPDRAGAMILFYNKDMFDKAGVSYPTKDWTWDDMLQAAQKLTIREGNEVKQYGFMTISWWPYWMSFIYQNGGRVLDENGKPVFNTPEVKEALQFYNDLAWKYKVSPTPADAANMGNVGPDQLFAQGKLAMELTGFWNIQSLMNVPDLNWDIAPMWRGKERAIPAFFNGLAIAKDSKHKKEAFQVLTVMASKEGQLPIAVNGEDVPGNKHAVASEEFLNPGWLNGRTIYMQTFAESAEAYFVPPLNPQWNEMMKVIDDKLGVFLNNEAGVDETVEAIQQGLEKLYS